MDGQSTQHRKLIWLHPDNYRTILGCCSCFKREISRIAVDGMPSSSASSRIFFRAMISFVTLSFACAHAITKHTGRPTHVPIERPSSTKPYTSQKTNRVNPASPPPGKYVQSGNEQQMGKTNEREAAQRPRNTEGKRVLHQFKCSGRYVPLILLTVIQQYVCAKPTMG